MEQYIDKFAIVKNEDIAMLIFEKINSELYIANCEDVVFEFHKDELFIQFKNEHEKKILVFKEIEKVSYDLCHDKNFICLVEVNEEKEESFHYVARNFKN